jgi:hypothetical protein
MMGTRAAPPSLDTNTSLLAAFTELVALARDPQFEQRLDAISQAHAKLTAVHATLEEAERVQGRRETELDDRTAKVITQELDLKYREEALVAARSDIAGREDILAKRTKEIDLIVGTLEGRERDIAWKEVSHGATMDALRQETEEDIQRRQQQAETAMQEQRAHADGEIATKRQAAEADIAAMRQRAEAEIAAKRMAVETALASREKLLAGREAAFNQSLAALQTQLAAR